MRLKVGIKSWKQFSLIFFVMNFVTQTETGKVVFISHLKRISYQKQKVKGFRVSCMTNYVFLEYEIIKFLLFLLYGFVAIAIINVFDYNKNISPHF